MSWSSLASNQCVSFNNLQDAVTTSVFALKNTIPVSLEQITKADADFYVFIDTAYPSYAAKASNQLVVKENLQPPPSTTTTTTMPPSTSTTTTTTTAGFYTYRLYGFGYGSDTDACSNQPIDSYSDVYAAEATLATVSRFYSDTSLITPVVGGSQWYAFTADGTTSPVYRAIVSNGGFLSSSGSC
jgi:hypothetical protein